MPNWFVKFFSMSDLTDGRGKGKKKRKMGHLSSMFNGLARSLSIQKGKIQYEGNSGGGGVDGREVAESMAKEAKKKELILRSSGFVNGSNNSASVFSKKGQKGINQDCSIVWEEYGGQPDMIFCGIFDGHGPWGHYVAKRVRESMASSLLCSWQETLLESAQDTADRPSIGIGIDVGVVELKEKTTKEVDDHEWFNYIWKKSYLKTCELVDQELQHHRKIDSIDSGSTALSLVKQGDQMVIANVGDSRAVLATTSDEDGSLLAVQLTLDFKPNLPDEEERIIECNGRVFCCEDEPGIHRVWLPNEDSPGLAMSRAFGDFCIKDFGLISEPQIIHRTITSKDHFLVLATDGVWDVVSNQEAVEIVLSASDRAKAAKRLVEYAVRAWKRKRRGIAIDDISAICFFFHSTTSSSSSSNKY